MVQDILQELRISIEDWLSEAGVSVPVVQIEHTSSSEFGEYTTNIAMKYAKELKENPLDVAERITAFLNEKSVLFVAKVEAVRPGFVNFYLTNDFFAKQIANIIANPKWGANESLAGKKIMVEYTQPNPFKPFHIGHLMSNAIGESLSRIVEFSGAETIRANYQGDVGPHVAKAVWRLLERGKPDEALSLAEQAEYIGECYVEANASYEADDKIKEEIDDLNKKIYERSDEKVNALYDWGKEITLKAFEEIYKTLGTKFDRYYFESDVAPAGKEIVQKNIGKVFTESDGAVVFEADKYDKKLHTRVFINSKGLPTYETKEIGLNVEKFENESPDLSIVVTAVEQADYMRVVSKALAILHPDYEDKMKHVSHGMMRFADGKMSSRTGNVVTGELLLKDAQQAVIDRLSERDFSAEKKEEIAKKVGVAALKYSILRQALGFNIVYSFEESISFEGDSGPYLQYATVRAQSILNKAEAEGLTALTEMPQGWEVTALEKQLYRFPEVVEKSYSELEPHHIVVYLTELASFFNTFYAQGKIIDDQAVTSSYKIALTQAFFITMKNGLALLGIETVDEM